MGCDDDCEVTLEEIPRQGPPRDKDHSAPREISLTNRHFCMGKIVLYFFIESVHTETGAFGLQSPRRRSARALCRGNTPASSRTLTTPTARTNGMCSPRSSRRLPPCSVSSTGAAARAAAAQRLEEQEGQEKEECGRPRSHDGHCDSGASVFHQAESEAD